MNTKEQKGDADHYETDNIDQSTSQKSLQSSGTSREPFGGGIIKRCKLLETTVAGSNRPQAYIPFLPTHFVKP